MSEQNCEKETWRAAETDSYCARIPAVALSGWAVIAPGKYSKKVGNE